MRAVPARFILLGLVAVSTLVRLLAARTIPAPWITPDEQTYALIGRSLYETGRFEILGRDAGLLSLVYPALIGVPFRIFDPHTAYIAVKAFQALLMSLTAVPVYLWGRSMMSRKWALSAAALTLAVPGLAYAGFLMTEVAFFPVLCMSAWAMARAFVEPSRTNQLVLLAAMLLAIATRLQAVVLVPVLVIALLLKLHFDRRPIGSLTRFGPLFAGLAAVTGIWVLLTTVGSGSGNRVLGSYQVVGTTSYNPLDVVRFGFYHLADVALMTALLPVVALGLLVLRAAAGRERSEPARAFIAVAVAYTIGFVAQVGLFTSSLLGRLGERYLLALAPLLFLSLALWLDRGAPRPRLATGLLSIATLGLLLALPNSFVSEGAAPDAFSTIPLNEIKRHLGASEFKLALLLAAAALLVLLAGIPSRRRWLLPAAVALLLIPASVSASRFVANQARGFRLLTVGTDERWIDRFAEGPVAFVYGGEYGFSAGGPVWANLFWNRSLTDVYTLPGVRLVGPIARQPVTIAGDGGLLAGGRRAQARFAVASDAIEFFGNRVNTGAAFALWRLDQPARISTRVAGIRLLRGDIDARARMVVYDCRNGALELQIIAPEARTVTLYRNGAVFRSFELVAGLPWSGSVPSSRGADGRCTFELLTQGGGVHADRFAFVRN